MMIKKAKFLLICCALLAGCSGSDNSIIRNSPQIQTIAPEEEAVTLSDIPADDSQETEPTQTPSAPDESGAPQPAPSELTLLMVGDILLHTPVEESALQADGTYQLVKTGLALADGNYKYKVAQDHAWGQSWPSSDAILAISETGTYDITFTFEPANGNKVSANAVKKGEADIEETWVVAGDNVTLFGTTWDATNEANKMTEDEDGNWVKVYDSVDLTAGVIEYKFVHNGSEWVHDGDNEKLEITEDGKYKVTFTYIIADDELNAVAEKIGEYNGLENVSAAKSAFVWYDLQGRSVKAPAKGLYIRDGKKVIVK